MSSILVAGATSTLGAQLLRQLDLAGHRVRALVRDPARLGASAAHVVETVRGDLTQAGSLRGACGSVEVVISCAGASMKLGGLRDRASFAAVDHRGNVNLLAEARAAGVRRFVYVSVFGADMMPELEYTSAHARFADELRSSGLEYTIVQPTGYFGFFAEFVKMARRGRALLVGDGSARTNPVHEAEVAAACVAAVEGGASEIEIGGPETFTRREIAELAFAAFGRIPRVGSVSPSLMNAVATVVRPINPRLAALVSFGTAASTNDLIAPAVGTISLRTYFAELARPAGAHRTLTPATPASIT